MTRLTEIAIPTSLRSRRSTRQLLAEGGAEAFRAWIFVQLAIGDECPSGDISEWTAKDYAVAAEWEGDPDSLVTILLTAGVLAPVGDMRVLEEFPSPRGRNWLPVRWREVVVQPEQESPARELGRRGGVAKARRRAETVTPSLFEPSLLEDRRDAAPVGVAVAPSGSEPVCSASEHPSPPLVLSPPPPSSSAPPTSPSPPLLLSPTPQTAGAPRSPFAALVARYFELFEEAYGHRPGWAEKEGKLAKTVLKRAEASGLAEAEVHARLERLYRDPPEWLTRGGGALTFVTFVAQFDALASGPGPPRSRARTASGEAVLSATEIARRAQETAVQERDKTQDDDDTNT